MKPREKARTWRLSEKEIDDAVVAQAEDEGAWGRPIRVRRTKGASLSLSADLAARAAFFARLHREVSVEQWLRRIIRERINLEEAALSRVKREFGSKRSA